jgi:two-component system, NtrC family, response regulator AtoC
MRNAVTNLDPSPPTSNDPGTPELRPSSRAAYASSVFEADGTTAGINRDATLGDRVLLVIDGAALQVVPLPLAGTLTVGRGSKCDVVIESGSVSRHHANLAIGQTVTVEDMGSSNGTVVEGVKVAPNQPVALTVGVPFLVGAVTLMLQTRVGSRRDTPVASNVIGALEQSAQRIAIGKLPVLLIGEAGVGKERFAERLHEMSPRRTASFVRVNCNAISESLLETELFGSESSGRPGMIEAADAGTLFLNDIDQLSLGLQQKLVRVIEDGAVRRVGSQRAKAVDVRFIASTSSDLSAAVEVGTFRRDLYFRMAGATYTIPPLRERKEDIIPLAEQFLASASGPLGRSFIISEDARQWLTSHHWPGNIRELRNACERAVLLATGATIEQQHLTISSDDPAIRMAGQRSRAATVPPPAGVRAPSGADMPTQVRATVAELEKQRIVDALEKCAGNQTRAAELLGISRRTLINRLDEYGIARPRKREE